MTDERRALIAQSAEFVAIVTDSFFAHPAWREDVAVALELGKPITFLLREGTTIPEGAFRGVTRVVWWKTLPDLYAVARDLSIRLGPNVELIDGALP